MDPAIQLQSSDRGVQIANYPPQACSYVRGSSYPGYRSQARGSSYPAAVFRPWGSDSQLSIPSMQLCQGIQLSRLQESAKGSSYPAAVLRPWGSDSQLSSTSTKVRGSSYPGHIRQARGIQLSSCRSQAVESRWPTIQPKQLGQGIHLSRLQESSQRIQLFKVQESDQGIQLSSCRPQTMGYK